MWDKLSALLKFIQVFICISGHSIILLLLSWLSTSVLTDHILVFQFLYNKRLSGYFALYCSILKD